MNPTRKESYDKSHGALTALVHWLACFGIASLILTLICNKWFPSTDATDKDAWTRSDLKLCVDYGTGCHYLFKDGVLIPRLDAEGKQVMEPKP